MLFHLGKDEQDILKKLFETKDSSKIREFIDNRLDGVGVDVDAWWYDEPYNLRIGIEVDNKEYDSGHASKFVNEDTVINAQSQCPNIQKSLAICERLTGQLDPWTYETVGSSYKQNADYKSALSNYEKALSIREINDPLDNDLLTVFTREEVLELRSIVVN